MNKNIKYSLDTFKIEGLKPSEEAINYMYLVSKGKMTLTEALELIKEKYKIKT